MNDYQMFDVADFELTPFFPFQFIALWLVVCAVVSLLGGWFFLIKKFKTNTKPVGESFSYQVKRFGFIPESGATKVVVSNEGLYLSKSILFRFLHPPLLIPWSEIFLREKKKSFLSHRYDLDLANTTMIIVGQKAFETIQNFLSTDTVNSDQ